VTVGLCGKDVPVPTDIPPQLPEYHLHKPDVPRVPPDKLKTDWLPAQLSGGDAEAEEGTNE